MAQWIDEHISAEQHIIDINSTSDDIKYAQMVKDYMTHTCSGSLNGCLDENGKCKKNFIKNRINETTTFNENGFPQYKRRSQQDSMIVPHNKKVLLAWNGHANVEYAGSTSLVMYLYKV